MIVEGKPLKDNTKRFSDRVENYVKFRPSYPSESIAYIAETGGLSQESCVADVGSGTGIFTRLLLDKAGTVYAVEPNESMRKEAERELATDRAKALPSRAFVSVNGSAECTTLPDASVDAITVAQAFHWFDPENTKKEFRRILKKNGAVFLVWNRRISDTPFLAEYEKLLSNEIPEYGEVRHDRIDSHIIAAFLDRDYRLARFRNAQRFDWDGLIGRFCSSSYSPNPGTPQFARIERILRDAFDRHAKGGCIFFNYETEVHTGKFA